jgi:hypothetical protein
MTRPFDAKAKAAEVGGFWPLSEATSTDAPRTMRVRPVEAATLRGVMASYHYSGRMPDAVQECFAGYYGETFAGGLAFGPGAASVRTELPDLTPQEVRELVRLWSPDGMPKNTESRLVARALRMLSGIRLVVSFSDPSEGHVGTIYQATNAVYLGMSGGGTRYLTPSGERLHGRLAGVYRMRHPEYAGMSNAAIATAEGWVAQETGGKHRYAWALGSREDRATLAALAQPYPRQQAVCEALVDGEPFVGEASSNTQAPDNLLLVQPRQGEGIAGESRSVADLKSGSDESLAVAHGR